jgi:hypothetical protein
VEEMLGDGVEGLGRDLSVLIYECYRGRHGIHGAGVKK